MRRLVLLGFALLGAGVAGGCGDDGSRATGAGGSGGDAQTSTSNTSSTGAGGALGCEAVVCDAGSFCFAGACNACDDSLGSLHDQMLPNGDSSDNDRFYFLHVPASYSCGVPAPLLVDFHGTAGGNRPEEAYELAALLELSEDEGAIVVRPRSLSSVEGGGEIFRWDQNPGDIARNIAFSRRLTHDLQTRFRLDPQRLYATGFSSGANMTAQFFGNDNRDLFRGLAPIAGGIWGQQPTIGTFASDAPRAYFATGFRDYLYPSLRELKQRLVGAGLASDLQWSRELDTGHELYAFEYAELFGWLDRGERPADLAGAPLAPWVAEASASSEALLTLERRASGELWAGTQTGAVLARSLAGTWSQEVAAPAPGQPVWTGACQAPSGERYLVGEGRVQADLGSGFGASLQLPELGAAAFGFTYGNGVACDAGGAMLAAGYWSAVKSADGGLSFEDVVLETGAGYEAQAAVARTGPSGATVIAGYYNYVARLASYDAMVDPRPHQVVAGWWTDVAAGPAGLWFACGDTGAVIRSTDDGVSWLSSSAPASEPLYAMAISPNGLSVAAVGHGGQVVYSRDGGLIWETLPTGLDRMLSAVAFSDDDTVVVAGEGGLVMHASLP